MKDLLAGTLSIDDVLLHSKRLEPLPLEATAELQRIQGLQGLEAYREADVREEIITPILRALGYEKGSIFSIEREKKLDFLDKRRFVDYSATLFQENFWLIEAKRPQTEPFGYKELWQALQYAIHPEINAALVVLCDGYKLEVFDREASLAAPILRIEREHLVRDFDKLRAILSPWQSWLFQKRRVVRLIDKVLDREFNMGRVDEFRDLVNRRLDGKRTMVLNNMRAMRQKSGAEGRERDLSYIHALGIAGIVDGMFFLSLPHADMEEAVGVLIEHCRPSSFHVLYKIFPDHPRDTNDLFYMWAIRFLTRLGEERPLVPWLPRWLSASGPDHRVEAATAKLIGLCLSCFAGDEARKIVHLYSACLRRVFKALLVTQPDLKRHAGLRHALVRYAGEELTFNQFVSSPHQEALRMLDDFQITGMMQFVRRFSDKNGALQVQSAREELREAWRFEQRLLASVNDYPALLKERGLGELASTEASCVVYDQMGHNCLCAINLSEKWKAWTTENHRAEVERLAALGSWQAREWLERPADETGQVLPDQEIADQFFLGDVDVMRELRRRYGRE